MSNIEQMYHERYNIDNLDVSVVEPKTQTKAVLSEKDPLTEQQLILDATFQENAQVMYDLTMAKNKESIGSDNTGWAGAAHHVSSNLDDPVDIAKWAVGSISMFRNNASNMMVDLAKLSKADPDLVVAFNNVNTMYSQTPTTGKQFARGLGQAIADPMNFLGFTAIAKTATAGQSGKQLATSQLSRFAQSIMQKRAARVAATGAVTSAEGAAFSGGVTYGEEKVKSMATGEDLNTQKVAIASGVGAVAAPLLGGSVWLGAKGYKGTKQFIQSFRVKRGQGEYGGNSFTDSDAVANSYASQHENGTVREVEISAQYPGALHSDQMTGNQLADDLDLNVDLGDEVRPTHELLDDPAVISAIESRGIDMVAYPEKVLNVDTSKKFFHGTIDDFAEFSNESLGKSTEAVSASKAHWLIDDPDQASNYAQLAAYRPVLDMIDKAAELENSGKFNEAAKVTEQSQKMGMEGVSGQNVRPVYPSGNIKGVDMAGASFHSSEKNINSMLDDARAEGFDGIRFDNFADDPKDNSKTASHIAIFDGKNIKSMFDTYDEIDSAASSLDSSGTATSYKTFGKARVTEVNQ